MKTSDIKYALNAIQWINVKSDPSNPRSERLWRYRDPAFVAEYPGVLREIKEAGFDAVMMEVLDTQTLQSYDAMIRESALAVAPGYLSLKLPSDHGVKLRRGSPEHIRWFDGARRRAEETNHMGLDTIFVAAEVDRRPGTPRIERAAVGADFSRDRLDEFVELITDAAEVLRAEGVRAGLHNHVGTWVETGAEIDYVLQNVDAALLGASFDIGHLAWAGLDVVQVIQKWSERILDLHIKDVDLAVAQESREHPGSYYESCDLGVMIEPGLGQLDIVAALEALPIEFDGWAVIEVDVASMDPGASARHTAAWLNEIN